MSRSGIVAAALLLSSACSLPLWDRSARIARLTFDGDWHPFDSDVYQAALSVKFPDGSAFSGLEAFVGRLKGDCRERSTEPGVIWCEIPVRGGICWAQMIGIEVKTEAQTIASLKVHSGGLGC